MADYTNLVFGGLGIFCSFTLWEKDS